MDISLICSNCLKLLPMNDSDIYYLDLKRVCKECYIDKNIQRSIKFAREIPSINMLSSLSGR
jgi:hypothetical protein